MATTTTTVPIRRDGGPPAAGVAPHAWWVYLTTGVLWLVASFAILNGREEITTVRTVAVLTGFVLVAFAIGEFGNGIVAEGWRWLHLVLGVVSLLAATFAFVWPGQTFLTLAAIIGWYLLAVGILHIWQAFLMAGLELWWVGLVIGIAEIALAFWAVGYPGRSIRLLIVWVSAMALARGLLQVVTAFSLRSEQRAAVAP